MSHTIKISDLIFGGNGADNPNPLTRANYDLSSAEQLLSFRSMNVIIPNPQGGTFSVTGLIVLDSGGNPLVGPNDLCFVPCPPYCH
ncbi:MAG: hypothetical protein ABIQ02_12350 [Saprospiraceae bacterium]